MTTKKEKCGIGVFYSPGFEVLYSGTIEKKGINIWRFPEYENKIIIKISGPRFGGPHNEPHVADWDKFINKYKGVIPDDIIELLEQEYFIHKL